MKPWDEFANKLVIHSKLVIFAAQPMPVQLDYDDDNDSGRCNIKQRKGYSFGLVNSKNRVYPPTFPLGNRYTALASRHFRVAVRYGMLILDVNLTEVPHLLVSDVKSVEFCNTMICESKGLAMRSAY
ncbi:hypothetical protein Tco_1517112 [Tanacetum coccineum]